MSQPEIIYDGRVQFTYNDGQHVYTVSKKVEDVWPTPTPVMGITTVTSIINKEGLIGGASKVAAYHMRDRLKAEPKLNLNALAEEAKGEYRRKWAVGARTGSVGHKLVESLLMGKKVIMPSDEALKAQIENIQAQHLQFEEDFKPETIHVEKPMYSLEHNFTGKDDRLCKIGDKTILVDYKTTNRSLYAPDGIYADNFAQLGGQMILVEEMLGLNVDDAWIVNFDKESREYRLRQLSELPLTKTHAKLYFLDCLGLYEINKLFNWKV